MITSKKGQTSKRANYNKNLLEYYITIQSKVNRHKRGNGNKNLLKYYTIVTIKVGQKKKDKWEYEFKAMTSSFILNKADSNNVLCVFYAFRITIALMPLHCNFSSIVCN